MKAAINEIKIKMDSLKIQPDGGPKADIDIGQAIQKRFRPPHSQVIEEADEQEGELDTEDSTVYEFMKNYMEYEEEKEQAEQQASPTLKLMLMQR